MMKRQILFLLLFFVASHLSAQPIEIIDFEGFTGTNIGTVHPGWQEAQGENQPSSYSSSSWFASNTLWETTGAGVLINSNSHREWLISPEFTVTDNTKLNFWAALSMFYDDPGQGYFGFDDSMAVMISLDNGDFVPAGLTFDVANQPSPEMEFFTLDLSDFSGSNAKIAFYATDGNMANGLACFHLDDIVIMDAMPADAAILNIVSPTQNECFSGIQPVTVRLMNAGSETLFGIPVRIRARGANTENLYAVYENELLPGESTDFEAGTIDMSAFGNYTLSATTEYTGDETDFNNTAELSVNNPEAKSLPSILLNFTDYYTDNLSEIYPGWYEARGKDMPLTKMNVDWQGDFLDSERTASVYFVNLGTEDWLVGPKYQIEAQSVLQLKAAVEYDEGTTQMGSDDKLAVMVSADCGATWQELGALDNSSGLISALKHQSFSLADFAGQEIIIALYATTGNTMDSESYLIHIDDLIIKNQYETDAGISALISPAPSCSFSSEETIIAEIKNWGNSAISNFDISYTLNSQTPVTETFTSTLFPGDEAEYSFTQTANLSQAAEHNLTISLDLDNDEFPDNNTLSKIVRTSSFDLATDGNFTMSFEADEDYSDWHIEDANGDNAEWEITEDNAYAHSGNNSMSYFSNNSSTPSDDWLISPCFNLQSGREYKVSFWYKNRASAYPESLKLNLGSTQNGSAMSELIIDLGEISNSEYLQATASFSVPTDGEYYFGWHAYGPADQFGMHLDDIEISQIFDTDLTISNINIPRNKDTGCGLLPAEEIYAEITNVGTTTVNEFELSFVLNGTTAEVQTFTQTIAPDESLIVTFNQNVYISPDAEHDIQLTSVLAADENAANDSYLIENFVMSDFAVSFEPSELYGEWTTQSNAGVNEWNLHEEQSAARTGDFTYSIRTDGAGGNSSNDDWLFSECFELEAGICYNLNFFYRSRFSTENLSVYIGNEANAAAMTEMIFDDPDFSSDSYLEANVPFTLETSGVYYIAWHTDGGTSGRYYIHLDDVSLNQSVNSPIINSLDVQIFDREAVFSADIENGSDLLWDFGDGQTSTEQNPTHIYETAGDYTAVLQLSDNCLSVEESINVTIDCESPQADFDYITDGASVQFSTLSAADYYAWNFGDGNYSSEQNPTHVYDVSTPATFDVMLSLYNGCGSDYQTQNIGVLSAEAENLPGIKLYPNPTDDFLSIQFPDAGNYQIRMHDISGKLINETQTSQNIHHIDMQNAPAGLYFLNIKKDEKTAVFKIIKNR